MEKDFYIFNINKTNLPKINNLKFNKYFVTNYEIPVCQGVFTENIFEGLIKTPLKTFTISKNIKNTKTIYGIIIEPNLNDISINFETFIMLNFYDREYVKNILNIANYYDIFDTTKISTLRNYFNSKYKSIEVLNINNNFNKLINSNLPFNYIILKENEIDNFINKVNIIEDISNINWVCNCDKIRDIQYKSKTNNINYIVSEINFGFGDLIQRYEHRLLRLLDYSSDNFTLVNNKTYSYKNKVHNNCKYLGMYHFPGFNFAPKNDNIDSKFVININYQTLMELIIYNKSFFQYFDNKNYLVINLSSSPGLGLSNNSNYNYHSTLYKKNIQSKKLASPYSRVNWNFKKFSDNNIIILHFRRGDYVNMILQNNPRARTAVSFDYIIDSALKQLKTLNEKNVDAVIISDHYDIKKIDKNQQKYVPILFDYNNITLNQKFIRDGVTITIKDKIIGENNSENEYKILKYLANCKYHIGNMSCFPLIISETFGNNLITLSRDIISNIRNCNDLDYLINNNDYYTPSYRKYKP